MYVYVSIFFFFKQKTAYEMRISDWSSDVCSSDLLASEVFVLGHTESKGEGRVTVPSGEKLSIVNWEKADGTPVIPFFASLEALRRALKEEQSYVALPARSLFEVPAGATLVDRKRTRLNSRH